MQEVLTPRDIHEAEFKRVWKGYSPEEVDAFLSRVVSAYETVYQENNRLKSENADLKKRLEEASRSEGLTAEALAMAKQTAEEFKEAARLEAEARLREAESQAEQLIAEATRRREDEERAIQNLKREISILRSQVQRAVDEFFSAFDGIDDDGRLEQAG